MSARLPSQPVWPEKRRRVFFIYNLNLPAVVVLVALLVSVAYAFTSAAGRMTDDHPLAIGSLGNSASAPVVARHPPMMPNPAFASPPAPVIAPAPVQAKVMGQAKPLTPALAEGGAPLTSPGPRLSYVPNSSTRVEQLIGDVDLSNKLPTVNLTQKRYGIKGTDLGYSFEHNGRLYFLFGDTLGPIGGDVVGISDSTDPSLPMKLDFMTDAAGNYLVVEPPAISMEGYETPVSGISIDGKMYVLIKSTYMPPYSETVATMLTRYDEASREFRVQRWVSSLPGGHFITPSLHLVDGPIANLDGDGPWVLMFGSGAYRESKGYLAATPAASFAKGDGTRYFAGFNNLGPIWRTREADAQPIIDETDVGDISVTYIEKLGVWVSLYDSLEPRGILARYAAHPWGPWSAPQILYEPSRETGYGVFIYDPSRTDNANLAGPIIDPDKTATTEYGGFYAPYLIERFSRVTGDELTLHWVMSTWNPYVVVRMQSKLKVLPPEQAPEAAPLRTADLPAGYLVEP